MRNYPYFAAWTLLTAFIMSFLYGARIWIIAAVLLGYVGYLSKRFRM